MEDNRGKERAYTLFHPKRPDPVREIEKYQVSLRKKRKTDLFMKKRKILLQEDSEMNPEESENIVPGINELNIVEKVEVLAEKIIKDQSDRDLIPTLGLLSNLIMNNWNIKFLNIISNAKLLRKFQNILKEGHLESNLNIIAVLINIMFYVKPQEVNPQCIFEEELIQSVYENLCLPENQNYIYKAKYLKAMICLANINLNYPDVSSYLIQNSVFEVLNELCNINLFSEDPIFID